MLLKNESRFLCSHLIALTENVPRKGCYFLSFKVSLLFIDSPYRGAFLTRMRDYMPAAHCHLIETLSVSPSLRILILTHYSPELCLAHNSRVLALVNFQ